MKAFRELLSAVEPIAYGGPDDSRVEAVVTDSRKVSPGSMFVAVKGARSDGQEFVPEAISRGATAVISDRPLNGVAQGVSWLQVRDVQDAIWRLAHALYGDPTARLRLIGVTGTNGKTTTTHLIRSILEQDGSRCALMGTVGATIGDQSLDFGHTTPMANEVAYAAHLALEQGCRSLVMEVSSHALALKRVEGCRFDAGTYTNLTPEHLDFHQNMDDYYATKARLFSDLALAGGKTFVGTINMDDVYGPRMATEVRGKLVTFGRYEGEVRASSIDVQAERLSFVLDSPWGSTEIEMPLGGRFNVSNGLAAAATMLGCGIPIEQVRAGLAIAKGAPGRFESVPTGRGFSVIVDYAHSPDALEKLLEACRELEPKRMTVVFGCGGDRDATKRPRMGAIATELADRVIVTSDNPRTEDPQKIIDSILAGVAQDGMKAAVEVEPDRRRAIHLAIHSAEPGDLIVVAGKGHEDYQILGYEKIHFDDREVVREALQ